MEDLEEPILLENESKICNKKIRKNKLQIKILAIILSVIFVMISAFVVLAMFAEDVYIYTGVEGPSMKPTINADAPNTNEPYDHAYVNTYQKGTYNDIIVIQHTEEKGEVRFVIKRLIGMGGDTIKIDDSGIITKVYRNGELLKEDYIKDAYFTGFKNGISEITIPQGYIFYMGDNRNNSNDCRHYDYTEVPYCEKASNIIGRVDYIVPFEQVEKGDGKDNERFWKGMKEIFYKIF